MDIDQLAKFLSAVAGVVGVFVTVVLAVRKSTDRESLAHRRAYDSLQLLKAWREVELSDGEHGDERARQAFRRDLIDRASHFTQIYVSSTRPVMTSYWQPVIFGVFSFAWLGAIFFGILGPIPTERPFWLVLFLMLFLAIGLITILMCGKVGEYKADLKAVNRARNRREPAVKRSSRRRGASSNLVSASAANGTAEASTLIGRADS